ncbi:unnamed protein product [Schistosoma mattheei]|uniref:protein disulfide-isomerase n=1 Tax=Schistosoma mattheei TaxID=31246 RepID=A0A3P8FBN2_9TREM|nr:unnamed protein product [Schistosoma mattheei]
MIYLDAPWCGHCKALAPEYSAAAKKLKDKGSLVKLAKVDATVEEELAFKHAVKGYPTLKFFRNEQPIDFGGERDSDAIDTDSLDLADFEKVADELDDADFAIANSSDILTEYGITQTPKIVLFKNVSSYLTVCHLQFDDNRVEYTGETLENLKHFVQVESVPLVSEFSQKTAGIVFGSPIQKHIVFFLSKSTDHSDLVGKLTEVARQFKGKLHVVYVDVDVENNLRVLEFFGLSKNDAPTYRIIELGEETTKYKPDTNDYSVSAMSDFVQRTIDGKVKPFLMSEEIPSDQTGSVKVLVGKNYNDVVKDKSKDVFVKLYAPWCGHCKALAPVWDELGETFKNSDTVIAKMDATVNEVEDLKVTSFPTLKFYPKNSDEVIDYTGDRSFEALKKFVESGGKSSEATKQEDQIKDEL